jgi:hypothetical protein
LHQIRGAVAVGREHAHPDACGRVDFDVVQQEGGLENPHDLADHRADVVALVQVGHQDIELVPADAGHGVRFPHAPLEPLGHRLQQQVPGGVPQRVVDLLEVIQVEKEHRQVLPVAPRLRQLEREEVHEQLAVGEVGERVVQCLVPDGFLPLGSPGDVAGDPGKPDGDAVGIRQG